MKTISFIIYQSSNKLFSINLSDTVNMLEQVRKAAMNESECFARWRVSLKKLTNHPYKVSEGNVKAVPDLEQRNVNTIV